MNALKTRNNLEKILRVTVIVIGWLPLVFLLENFLSGDLGFNPIETILRRTGRIAVLFLLLSLLCTPINKIFKLPLIGRLRKPLGLFAALYAGLHFATFAIWDYQLDLRLIWSAILEKPFILLGAVALVILTILAGTSFRKAQQKLGKTWIWLHRTVYLAAILAIIHYLLAVKGDLFSLQGNYTLPLLAAGALLVLFVLRIPGVYRFFSRLFKGETKA
jgi:sulfoxide reductase heme-binding subunit YedZ